MATPIHALLQHNDGATEIEVSTKVTTVIRTWHPAMAPTSLHYPESPPQSPSHTAPNSEPSAPQTRHAITQTDPEPPSSSISRRSDDAAPLFGPDSYPQTISCPSLMYKPPRTGEYFYVIYAGAHVGIFGDWRDEVCSYVEGIAGVHYKPFTTYEAALQAYTDTYNCEEYSPQLKMVEHPNLNQGSFSNSNFPADLNRVPRVNRIPHVIAESYQNRNSRLNPFHHTLSMPDRDTLPYLKYWCPLHITGASERIMLMAELQDELLVDCLIEDRQKRRLEITARLAPIERDIFHTLHHEYQRRGYIITDAMQQRLHEEAHDRAVLTLENMDLECTQQHCHEDSDRLAQLRLARAKAIKEGTYQRAEVTYEEDDQRISQTVKLAHLLICQKEMERILKQ
ncbi:hypothetical protein BT96DRAFT_1005459 [Gymnopus androsaceus JB14]|uniref:Ribonuclease H1 N-terminal domain-containing protein n=1 Tax=Gymnopus androsaceus JB14 TaxID=1447944 RepID=A0A6A4GPD4_9AGAR|nr:hypothetical protein BT96DRAFT_1005459 [Gymnopus androsaceus JB14]